MIFQCSLTQVGFDFRLGNHCSEKGFCNLVQSWEEALIPISATTMGGSRVQVNKAHKTRFASKSSRNLHKTAGKGLLFYKFASLYAARVCLNWRLAFWLGCLERIGKSEHNVGKGARAARIQRSKMVCVFVFMSLMICICFIVTDWKVYRYASKKELLFWKKKESSVGREVRLEL